MPAMEITVKDADIEAAVIARSKEAGVSVESYVQQAIEDRLEDEHFAPLVEERIAADAGQRYSTAEIREDLGLDD